VPQRPRAAVGDGPLTVPPVPCTPVDPFAAELARLLCDSDLEELAAVVRRWLDEAPTVANRRQCQALGAKLIELKRALAQMPVHPTRDELEFQLTLMLRLAASSTGPALR
jgi:hypothetical protein